MANDLRERLILATIETGADNGVENLRLKDVAKLCGVSAPAMYYHFKSKYELLYECILYVVKRYGAIVREIKDDSKSYKENFMNIMHALAKHNCKYKKETIFYNRTRVVPYMEITFDDHTRLRSQCSVYQFLLEGVNSGELIKVEYIASQAYYPLINSLMYYFIFGSTPTQDEIDRIIISLWHSVSTREPIREQTFSSEA